MSDQERDALLVSMAARLVSMAARLEQIEGNMLTIEQLAEFMRTAFGEMVSVMRVDAGVEAVRRMAG